jgi:hypothetical protein
MPRCLIGGDLKYPKCRRWSSSRIGGAGSMPLGFITLLSEKGGHCDENETQKSTFFFISFLVMVGIVLFSFLGFP